jgi:ferrous iron transport protein B
MSDCHASPVATVPGGEPVVAIAGNPNAGKSTLFNALTGLRQHTGNWPGKTVARREGAWVRGRAKMRMVDLPGAYSLSAFTPEEVISRDFILADRPAAVINVVDATNLERNLYLTVQLLELGAPLVVALNMTDELPSRGLRIDEAALSAQLAGTPVVRLSARRGEGIDRLMDVVTGLVGLAAPEPVR